MSAPWEPPTVEPMATPKPGRRNRRTAAIGLTAGLIGGGAIGLMLGVPGLSSAATDASSDGSTPAAVVDESSTAPTDTPADTPTDAAPGDRLREALQPLVDDGTLTSAQADSVATFLAANRPEGDGVGDHGGRGGHPGFDGEVVAGLIGIDAETLRSGLADGKTIAEIATANGVEPQTVIDALVAEAKTHLDLSVTNGRLTQEEADAKLTEMTQRITDRINNGGPVGGPMGGGGGGRGPQGAPPADAPAEAPAPPADSSATADSGA